MPDRPDFAALDALLDQALERPPRERAQWIEEACRDQPTLRKRLLRLVALAEGDEHVLPPAGGLRGEVWEDVVRDAADEESTTAVRSGERLGRYEIRGLLGAGAMGRVYRGFDPALGREVAIKSLLRAWGDGAAEERRRFEREARLLATLNHPNIAAIYGWEIIDDAPYLVLELVEGQTLAERLRRGALPLADAVSVALEIVAALEEAHAKGVVHRDLKPANVVRDATGRVKVLDFGIAKVVEAEGSRTSDPQPATTSAGAILGTAPYMSPEQVRGDPVDTRTDVWAFGAVLYEMLSGHRAFDGRGPAEIMAAVLRDEVDWSRLPAGTPAAVRRLLRRCLRRDLRERLQDIGDARLELLDTDEPDLPRDARPRRALVPWLVSGALAAALAFFWTRPAVAPGAPSVVRLALELPADLSLANDYPAPFDVSPDGARLVVLALRDGVQRLYLRRVDGATPEPLAGTDGAWQPSFTPDGRAITFLADRKVKRVGVDGGPVLVLAEASGNARGAAAAPDGSVVYAPSASSGLMQAPAGGGTPRELTRLDLAAGESSHRWPQVLPGGRWVLFTTGYDGATFDESRVDAVALDTGERRPLITEGAHARYAGGRLYFARAGRLFGVAFDPATLAVRGTPEMVLEGVHYDPRNGGAHFAVSESGTLVYVPAAPTSPETYLSWVDARGTVTRIGDTPRLFREPRLSPDGRRVAARIGTESASDLWMIDATAGTLTRLSFDLQPRRPVWRPDGRAITVAARADGRWRILNLPLAGATTPVVVHESENRLYPNAWTPDARALVFQERRPTTRWDLRMVEVGGDGRATGAPRDLATTPFNETYAAVSRDGRLFAYDSDELDQIFGVYIAPLEAPAARVRAALSNARWPRWGRDEDLFCWLPTAARPGRSKAPEGLHRIPRRAGGAGWAPAEGEPLWAPPLDALAIASRLTVATYAPFDVDLASPQPRFLVLEAGAHDSTSAIGGPVVVLNWPRELDAHGLARGEARP